MIIYFNKLAALKNYVQENCVFDCLITLVGMFDESIKLTLRDCVNTSVDRKG